MNIKRGLIIVSAAALSFALATPLMAQEPGHHQIEAAQNFFDNHRDIEHRLAENPNLVDNDKFKNDHPELRDFLRDHPEVRRELKNDPDGFMHRVERENDGENNGNGEYHHDRDRDNNY